MTTWDDLAAVALLGTARRDVDTGGLPASLERARAEVAAAPTPGDSAAGVSAPGVSTAAALLDLAALAAVYRRAGVRPSPGRPSPEPSPPDGRPVVAPAAASRLATVLARADAELATVWLTTAADRGVRPPDRLLPALLDQACRHPSVAAALVRAAGPRARWLAAQHPLWVTALPGDGGDDTTGDGGPVPQIPDDAWTTGTPQERLARLRGLRLADPAAARELLQAGWKQEAPRERAGLLGTLELGLTSQDEPFLEQCLADRRGEVRQVAADLLGRLPGSGLCTRAAARAAAAVRVERQMLRRRLVVDPPRERDEGMARDQVPPAPGAGSGGQGPGAWYLRHVVAAAPLRTWVPAVAPTPPDVVALDVAGGWRTVLWCGWAGAAVRERDVTWARALLGRLPADPAPREPRAGEAHEVPGLALALAGLLPVPARTPLVVEWLANGRMLVADALASIPAPWPDGLAEAVVRRLGADDPGYEVRQLLDVASRRLPPHWAPALTAAGAQRSDPALRRRHDEAADLVLFRHEMLEEIR